MNKHISVCVVTYNKAPFLELSIPSIIESMSYPERTEICILNNGSTDYTWQVMLDMESFYSDIDFFFLTLPENIGLNAYREIAYLARGEIIVTADDDIFYVSKGWEDYFERALYTSFSGSRFGYVGSDTINKDGGRIVNPIGYAVAGEDLEIEVGPVGGWFSATTRDAYRRVGGFHTGKPKMHLEDAEYQRAVWGAGLVCGTVLNVSVFHARSPYFYNLLDCRDTYLEKERLAAEAGIKLESINGS